MNPITELSPQQYHQITPLLGHLHDFPVVNAVIQGHNPGRIFADSGSKPQAAFVLTEAGFSYLCGDPQQSKFNAGLKELLHGEIFPAIRASADPALIFYPLNLGWLDPLKTMTQTVQQFELYRKRFTFHPENFKPHHNWATRLPDGCRMAPITQPLIAATGADLYPWPSPESFLQFGFGYWLMQANEILCECSTVFVGDTAVEINIHTPEAQRGKGFATLTAAAFIEQCLEKNYRPNWECWWDNTPSVQLAQKLGFEPLEDRPVLLVEFET